MKVFVSYSHYDRARAQELVEDIRYFHHDVWYDQELTGGQEWWDHLLAQLRGCDIFVLAMSPSWLGSAACNLEFTYAKAINRWCLPVVIEPVSSFRVLPAEIQKLQFLDYTEPTRDSLKKLGNALGKMHRSQSLPRVLPPLPPVPISQLASIAARLKSPTLSLQEQTTLLFELERLVTDPTDASDAWKLIDQLAQHPDVRWTIVERVNKLRAEAGLTRSTNNGGGNRTEKGAADTNPGELLEVGKSKAKFDTIGLLRTAQSTVQILGLSLPTFSSEVAIEAYRELLERGVHIQIIMVNPLSPVLSERPDKLYDVTQNVRIVAANTLRTLNRFQQTCPGELRDLFEIHITNITPGVGLTRSDGRVLWYPYFTMFRGAVAPYFVQRAESIFGAFVISNFEDVWNTYSYRLEGKAGVDQLREFLAKDAHIYTEVNEQTISDVQRILR